MAEGVNTLATQPRPGSIFATYENSRSVDIVVESGAGILKEGTMLGKVTASGKYKTYNPAATDGSEVFVGVLGCDVDASSSDQKAFMWVEGTFRKGKLMIAAPYSVSTGSYINGNIVIVEEG